MRIQTDLVVHFDKTACNIYIGRSSRFGNPYHVGLNGNRAEVIFNYELWLQSNPELIQSICRELGNKILGCHCAPELDCHGYVLARMANNWQLCMPLILENEIP